MKKYEIRKLKEYFPDFQGEKEQISIHTNHKGSLTKLSIDQNINFIGIVDFKVGRPPRGNHYHNKKDEYFYLQSGKVNLYFKDLDTGEVEQHIIESGTLVHILPGIAHAFTAIEDGFALEYYANSSEEILGDSFPVEVI